MIPASARCSSGAPTTETMYESNADAENSTGSPEDCPICGRDIEGIACSGPSAQTVKPCGCDLTAIDATVDEIASHCEKQVVDFVAGDDELGLLDRDSVEAWMVSDTTVEDLGVPEQ